MSDLKAHELAVAILGQGLVLATLAGLVRRHHVKICWAFGLYLLMVFLADGLMTADALVLRTGTFYSRSFWMTKEVLLNALKFAVALEIVARVFGGFPGARATAQMALVLLLGLTFVSVVSASGWLPLAPESLGSELQPRILMGTTWLFTVIAGLVLWYRLPMASMQKAILIGFVPFLILFYLVLELRTANRWPMHGWLASVDSWAFVLVLAYWTRSAWQPFREIIPAGGRPVPAVQGSEG